VGARSSRVAVAGASHVRRAIAPPSCFGTPGPSSVVAGGDSNVASGGDSGVLGGVSNQVCNNISSIVGGIDNTISDATDSANRSFIGGGQDNVITGSGIWAVIGGGYQNTLTGEFGVVGGGDSNQEAGNFAAVTGGEANVVNGGGNYGFIGGGQSNAVSAQWGTIGGGLLSTIAGAYGTVSGGQHNQVPGSWGAIGGGYGNQAAEIATVPGGKNNLATGEGSFAAGVGSTAGYAGDFVWSDFASGATALKGTAANQFLARASGGVTFYSSANLASGVKLAAGSGTWASLSDRSAKNGIVPVSDDDILSKVASLPISEWSYRTERGVRHVGPMAQDFYAAFGVGEDDRHITSIDEDGVALAAIKALQRENESLKTELRNDRLRQDAALMGLRREMTALEAKVAAGR
jgi:hypothetical protein